MTSLLQPLLVCPSKGDPLLYSQLQCTNNIKFYKSISVFLQAFAAGKCIASAHWLNDVLTQQKMFPPTNALHFPTAFKWQLIGADKYVSARNLTTTACLVSIDSEEWARQ